MSTSSDCWIVIPDKIIHEFLGLARLIHYATPYIDNTLFIMI